ncbi:MAG TPA: response regulator [Nitrospiraceae bacterium]|nr:response regulator [Nitrospiraceae bacterium]
MATAKRALVSIVDDDESVRRALKRLIQSVGLRAEVFASVDELLYSGQLGNTACLILDVVMPGTGGLDFQRRLTSAKQHIPIVFITAHDDDHARQSALALGAAAFLRKPFSDEALLDVVRSVLDIGQGK